METKVMQNFSASSATIEVVSKIRQLDVMLDFGRAGYQMVYDLTTKKFTINNIDGAVVDQAESDSVFGLAEVLDTPGNRKIIDAIRTIEHDLAETVKSFDVVGVV